ncbi:MAG: hypothetical protein ACI9HK_002336, partial [Pirellulaceae bacterium]
MWKQWLLAAAVTILGMISVASAHYLWVGIDSRGGDHGIANIYFEEGPAPGDGSYLDPFVAAGKTWIRTVAEPQAKLLDVKEINEVKKRWLQAQLTAEAPRSIDSYGKFGVYRYGQTDVLLHYYARNLNVTTHEDLHELSRSEQLDLDIVPHDHGKDIQLTVLWKGEPAVDRMMYIRGPKGFRKNVKTNDKGQVEFPIENPGQFLFRTFVEVHTPGKDDGKDYAFVLHI